MDAGTPPSSSFTVTSKPILPVDVSLNPKHPVQNLPLNHPSSIHFETYYPVPPTRSVLVPPALMDPHDSSSIIQIWPTVLRSIAPRHDLKTQVSTAPGQNPSSSPSCSNSVFRVASSEDNLAPPAVRQRTAQACNKCRERKTKCSGERPVCGRCTTRGLICHYHLGETKHRGPSRARQQTSNSSLNSRFIESASLTRDAGNCAFPVPSGRGSASLPSSLNGSPVLKSGKLLASDIDSQTQPQPFVQPLWLDPALESESKSSEPLPALEQSPSIINYPGHVEAFYGVGNEFMPRAETTPRAFNSMFDEYTQAPAFSPFPLVIPPYWSHAVDGSSSSEPISATDSHTGDSSDNSLSRSSSFFELDSTTPDGSPCLGHSGSSSGSSQSSSSPSSPVNRRTGLIVSSAEMEHQQSANYIVDSCEYFDFLEGSGGLNITDGENYRIKTEGPPQFDLDLTSDAMSGLASYSSLGSINHFVA